MSFYIDLMQKLNQIEKKLPVNDWVIDGVDLWPVIRLDVAYKMISFFDYKKTETRSSNKLLLFNKLYSDCSSFIKAYLKDYSHNQTSKKHDILMLTYTIHRQLLEEQYADRMCSPFVEWFQKNNLSTLLLETAPNFEYRIPRYEKSKFIQLEIIQSSIINNLDKTFKKTDTSSLLEYNCFLDYFAEETNKGVQLLSISGLLKKTHKIRLLAEYFKSVIRTSSAKIGLVAEYYGIQGFAFTLACYEMKIPSIDIQHGMQGRKHFAYGSWQNVPQKGYNVLPNYFWCWSSLETVTINNWREKTNVNNHIPIAGGNMWFDFVKEKKCYQQYNDIKKIKYNNQNKKHVILSLRAYTQLPIFLLEFMKTTQTDFFWWVREHPCDMENFEEHKKFIASFCDENVEFDIATQTPLNILLENMDLHITIDSSVVLDARHYNVPSIVVDNLGKQYYEDFIAEGSAFCCLSVKELISTINLIIGTKATTSNKLEYDTSKSLNFLLDLAKNSNSNVV